MTFLYVYLAVALFIGALFYFRNRWHVDAEFIFLCVGVGVLWPVAIGLDVALWWRNR